MKTIKQSLITCLFLMSISPAVHAQASASATSLQYARSVARACLADWTAQKCLSAVSDSNLVLLSNYGADFKNRKMEAAAETLKQHCAATTAANQQAVPAYAMHSALTECANTITDLSTQTGVQPDPSHYQLLIAPLLCLGVDPSCAQITEQMRVYAR